MDTNFATTTTTTELTDADECEERRHQAEMAASDRRLADLAQRVLARPARLDFDVPAARAWDEILEDVDMWCALDRCIERLIVEDQGFLRHVFQRAAVLELGA